MKKHEFIEQAMKLGVSLENSLFLEEIYNPGNNSTEKERIKALHFLEDNGTNELVELGRQYKNKIIINVMVEDIMVELDQKERDSNFGYDERVQFKSQLISCLTDFIQSDSYEKDIMPDFLND